MQKVAAPSLRGLGTTAIPACCTPSTTEHVGDHKFGEEVVRFLVLGDEELILFYAAR